MVGTLRPRLRGGKPCPPLLRAPTAEKYQVFGVLQRPLWAKETIAIWRMQLLL